MPTAVSELWKLAGVCLKMLFRKSTRKRFVCLVAGFLLMMGLNTFFYLQRYHEVEIEKRDLLEEKAFQVFFLRARTRPDAYRLTHDGVRDAPASGGRFVGQAFIYQNNLFIHFDPTGTKGRRDPALRLLDGLFGIADFGRTLFDHQPKDTYLSWIRDAYWDHNGGELAPRIVEDRHGQIQRDLYDLADMIRASLTGRRMVIYNASVRTVVEKITRIRPDPPVSPNPYLSRVETVIPVNLLYIFSGLQDDVTTDIVDLSESIRAVDGGLETFDEYLSPPATGPVGLLYADIDAYPRYLPVFVPRLLTEPWHWMMFRGLRLDPAFMAWVERRHFQGNLLFSYEKTRILKNRTRRVNAALEANQVGFFFTDITMGIAFPFMISLFAFIYLKTELAFLLMFKNRIRPLLWIFWLMPLTLMGSLKGVLTAGYLIHARTAGVGMDTAILWPLLFSFAVAAAVFYPVNRWCFSSFTSDNLSLYELHKGR